ncbi:erythromycin esterase family protein [Paenibacillus turicensis]|uniref:erythromycin esterase family protein n=1 Tax=Paenibacillus turicensis TaxID=160487 RepID=UPI003D271529
MIFSNSKWISSKIIVCSILSISLLSSPLVVSASPRDQLQGAQDQNQVTQQATSQATQELGKAQQTSQDKDKASSEWWQKNAHPIPITEANEAVDFSFLKPILQDKRVVSLGENFHRVKEYSSVKVAMIKYLHEELGYDVIAFESGMADAAVVSENATQLDADVMMGSSIFPVWHSEETLELFQYIKEQAKGDHPLYLAGYDMQFTSYVLTNIISKTIAKVDEQQAKSYMDTDLQAIQELYAILNKNGALEQSSNKQAYIKEAKKLINKYVPEYKKSIKFMKDHHKQLSALYPDNPHMINIMIRSMYDRISFLRMITLEDKPSYEFRDQLMFNNLQYLMNTVYKDKKFILWAHNDHLSKNTSKGEILEQGKWTTSFNSLGERLHNQLQDQLYVVGLFMNQGASVAITSMTPFKIEPRPTGSLEHTMMQSGYDNTFVDLSAHKQKDALNAWMFEPIYASEDGLTAEVISSNVMRFVPKEQFDGIIVVNQVSAPTPLKENAESDHK